MAAVQILSGAPYYTRVDGGAVLQTSGGDRYAVIATFDVLNVIRALTGTPTSVTQNKSTIFGTSNSIVGVAAAMSSDNKIHIVCQTDSTAATRDVAYCIYDCGTNTFGSWELVAEFAVSTGGTCSIDLDSGNKPHVVFTDKSGSFTRIGYTNKVSGSWITVEVVSTSTTKNYLDPSILIRNSDIVEVLYSNNTDTAALSRTRTSGSWGSETVLVDGGLTRTFNQTSTTGGTVYRYFSENTSGFNLHENTTDTGQNGTTQTFSAFGILADTTRFLVYARSSPNSIAIISNTGSGWSAPTQIQGSYAERLVGGWSYRNWNAGPSRIDYAFHDGDEKWYYDYYDTGIGGSTDYPISLDAGSYAVTGNAVTLTAARNLALDAGAYAVTGNAVGLAHGRTIALDEGQYAFAGQDVGLTVARNLPLDAGSYAITGNAVGLTVARTLSLDAGVYSISGNDVTLAWSGEESDSGGTLTPTTWNNKWALESLTM